MFIYYLFRVCSLSLHGQGNLSPGATALCLFRAKPERARRGSYLLRSITAMSSVRLRARRLKVCMLVCFARRLALSGSLSRKDEANSWFPGMIVFWVRSPVLITNYTQVKWNVISNVIFNILLRECSLTWLGLEFFVLFLSEPVYSVSLTFLQEH